MKLKLLFIILLITVILVLLLLCIYLQYLDNKKHENIEYKILYNGDNNNFLPFYLYSECLYNIMRNKLALDVEKIENFNSLDKNKKRYVIMFAQQVYNRLSGDIWNDVIESRSNIILINSEPHTDIHDNYIYKLLENNVYNLDVIVLEYNYKFFLKYPNLKIFYLPQMYDEILVQYYNSILKTQIKRKDKDIDILLFGNEYDRRKPILDSLRTKYKVVSIRNVSNEEAVNTIERSKIVINIFSSDDNHWFDSYRLAFLISNRTFIISETPIINENERHLLDFDNYLVHTDLNFIESLVDTYMDTPDNIIENIIDKQFMWFSKYSMENSVKDILNNSIAY